MKGTMVNTDTVQLGSRTFLAGREMKEEYFKIYSYASDDKTEHNLMHDFFFFFFNQTNIYRGNTSQIKYF